MDVIKPGQNISLLKSEDVIKIIRECSTTGVSEITYGELHVKFGATVVKTQLFHTVGSEESPLPTPEDETSAAAKQIEAESIEIDEIETRSQQIAELILSDPFEFEKQIASGELEDA
jgi:hypothetical protein